MISSAFLWLDNESQRMSEVVSENKKKYFLSLYKQSARFPSFLKRGSNNFEVLDNIAYLRINFNSNNNFHNEIQCRIILVNRTSLGNVDNWRWISLFWWTHSTSTSSFPSWHTVQWRGRWRYSMNIRGIWAFWREVWNGESRRWSTDEPISSKWWKE